MAGFIFEQGSQAQASGFAAGDTLVFVWAEPRDIAVSFTPASGLVAATTTLTFGGKSLTFAADIISAPDTDIVFIASGGQLVLGGAGADMLSLSDYHASAVWGLGSADSISIGGHGAHIAHGGIGADLISVEHDSEGNYTLYGDEGNDSFIVPGDMIGSALIYGGTGNDSYMVDSTGAVIIEAANSGYDTVQTKLSAYTLADNVEQLVLTGGGANVHGNSVGNYMRGGAGADTIDGGAGADALWGNGGNDLLIGGTGNDTLSGGAGADTMQGGGGNDVYEVQTYKDVVVEAVDGGTDIINSTVSLTLSANVENLCISGIATLGRGNALDNHIWNKVSSPGTVVTLDGGAGADTLHGGSGDDVFLFRAGQANGDVIIGFNGKASAVGDSMLFKGYGPGATIVIGTDEVTISYSGGIESIHVDTTGLDASDYAFI